MSTRISCLEPNSNWARSGLLLASVMFALACTPRDNRESAAAGSGADSEAGGDAVACPSTALTLPDGFCATVFADSLGHARHMAVSSNGTVYVNTWSGEYYENAKPPTGGFLLALKDENGDGRADSIVRFGDSVQSGGAGGTGIALYRGALFAEAKDKILRYPLKDGNIAPNSRPEVVVDGLPLGGDHPQHNIAIDSSGGLFMNSGSATNSCQVKNRIPLSPGRKPCTELSTRAGIWRYDANRTGQHFSPAGRYATGIRNAVGIAVDPSGKGVYATQHGRDQLNENWPKLYTPIQGQNFPSEELLLIERGAGYGWPQCYYDSAQTKLVLAPEYGGDGGKAVGNCGKKRGPVAAFPAHWAPNDLVFYSGDKFPSSYRGGAFIVFHGSWNRAPGPQGGYNVVFQPFADGKPSGKYEVFADGFAGGNQEPGEAQYRPSGVAVGPDGSLYISEDVKGRIWRVTYTGASAVARRTTARTTPAPGGGANPPAQRAESAGPPEGTHPEAGNQASRAPAGTSSAMITLGDSVYHGLLAGATCTGCHGTNAKGTRLAPDLTDDTWIWGDGSLANITDIIRKGVPAPKQHTGVMPPMGGVQLTPEQLKAVAAYVYSLSQGG